MTDTTVTPSVAQAIRKIATRAKVASRSLASATSSTKNAALLALADALVSETEPILAANAADVEAGRAAEMSPGLVDRLTLTPARIEDIAAALREVAALPDPVGEVVRGSTLGNGLKISQVRVPMGVVGMIYEARPNVTVDAAGLGLKSGNAVILRGGSAAAQTNTVIVRVLSEALQAHGLPGDLVQSIDAYGREGAVALMHARGLVDVLVPRGGASLIQTVVQESTVPAIETGTGNCHVYVDESADIEMARSIVVNSKAQRCSVCNAAETLLVHSGIAETFVPLIAQDLTDEGVTLHTDERSGALAGVDTVPAEDVDWTHEYLSMDLAVKVVADIDEAIDHIRTYTSGHTESIVTSSLAAANLFKREIDAAAIMVNASTRFTDGGQFGLGAEIGISTQKLHARGPMGLAELTTTTWYVDGEGQIRE